MHEWLPMFAAIGISVPISVHCRLGALCAGFLSGGLYALIKYFGS
jgi:hypothetical protein